MLAIVQFNWFDAKFSLLCCFRQLRMLKESEHMLKEALQTYTKLYGKESVVVAEVLNHLGVTYYRSSQLQKSWYAKYHYQIHSCKVVSVSRQPVKYLVFKVIFLIELLYIMHIGRCNCFNFAMDTVPLCIVIHLCVCVCVRMRQ